WMNEQDRVAMNVEKAERWGWEPEYFTLDASMSPLAFFSGASSKKILVTTPEGAEILKRRINATSE
ncbi:MAG: hypothetical protein RKH07_02985, partial [Gammaproteobacteria bacterium]